MLIVFTQLNGLSQFLLLMLLLALSGLFYYRSIALKALRQLRSSSAQTDREAALQSSPGEPSPSREKDDIQNWLHLLESNTLSRLSQPDFNIEILAADMQMSSRQLLRRLKQHTGLTFAQYLKKLRMERAGYMIKKYPDSSVKEICAAVGLRDVKYFSREFQKQFGVLPSEYGPAADRTARNP